MRIGFGSAIVIVCLAGGCALQSATKPVEYLDERTAMTVAALKDPIEFTPRTASGATSRMIGKRVSFAYLGPVEWDKAGAYEYGLWVHVAAGSDWTVADIRSPSAVTVVLDEGSVELVPIDAPQLGRGPYQPVASWGQTAYFQLNVDMLRRMAASQKLNLDVRGADGSTATFVPSGDTRAVLGEFIRARSLTGD
jgi:hypothetical protein